MRFLALSYYSIRAEPWADGAAAERWMAIPGQERLGGNGQPWSFPEGSVLVKTLSLELEAGRPESRRRVETQLLHLEDGAWRAYTYAWSEDQRDAELVGPAGEERLLEIRDAAAPGGARKRSWRFASRAECLLCHNTFAGSVLGASALQLDLDFDREGRTTSQLRSLAALGFFASAPSAPQIALADPHDAGAALGARARSYLHVNCSPCHQRHGGGNAPLELLYPLSVAETRAIDVRPALGGFGIDDARVIAPGDPLRSVLYYRMASRGAAHMPQLGPRLPDARGLDLIHRWIESLAEAGGAASRDGLEREALAVLLAGGGASAAVDVKDAEAQREQALLRLLGSTRGALILRRAMDGEAAMPAALRAHCLERAAAAEDPIVRDLFLDRATGERALELLGARFDLRRVLALEGDAARGKAIFRSETGTRCRSCHKVAGDGGDFGPELTLIGARYDRAKLLESLVEPSRSIEPRYAAHLLVTRGGETHLGILERRDGKETVLRSAQGEIRTFASSAIQAVLPQSQSAMPEALLKDLTAAEAADLLAYLASLK